MKSNQHILHNCLYFTANSLSRVITKMAEQEFALTGLSPSHAFLVMLVMENPGIGQTELARELNLAPSTVTRFIDTLAHRGYLERKSKGKASRIFPTRAGEDLRGPIKQAWKKLHQRYANILGQEKGDELARQIDLASAKLAETV
ncbi:MarR family winged helix-turn-helix transcriptional regulator [Dethiosulfatarculus sandiegensis]|uniref:MarR family transcriptional regulator n=1 Tax=Dethiosulfatarculus sandiegensis TaxID=1429043 RepID=A0A0D2JB17_9BACT|nr:MarR family transcriptional regulator [Dethiosulfatarculus sandiegensis]KIX15319.1 MarR family transcriptional regulator [Dethiosulfatarculus sandiegensis]